MKNAEYDGLVERIERIADSAVYPYLVLGWALFGYMVVVFGLLSLAGAVAGLVALVLLTKNVWFAAKGLKLAAPAVIALWVGFKSLWIRVPPAEGRRVTAREVPALFALIEKVRQRGRAKRVDEVLIVNELNAGVQATPRFGLLPIYKTSLTVGLPLMQATSVGELEAILAHEFGHLSGEHGRLSSWIYRVRRTWFQIMEHVEAQGMPGGKLMWGFLRWYIPRFGAWSFVLARRNEYEADRFSAACVGPRLSADALARAWIASAADDEVFWPALRKEVRLHALPPTDVQERRGRQLLQAAGDQRARLWLESALKRYTDTNDTHPSLRDRLKALGQDARVPPAPAHSAAEALLGPALGTPLQELGAEWRQAVTGSWAQAREQIERAHARAAELSAKPQRDDAEQLELARAYDELDESTLALEAYAAYLQRAPDDADALFAVGRIRLGMGDGEGVAAIEGAIRHDRDYALAGYQLIASFHSREGRRAEADRYLGHAEQRAEHLQDADRELNEVTRNDEFIPDSLAPDVKRALCEYLAARLLVKRAWLVRKKLALSELPLHVLVVELKLGFFSVDANADAQKMVESLAESMPDVGPIHIYATRNQRWIATKAQAVPGAQVKG